MDEEQIYRQAYWQSLPAAVIAAVVLAFVVGVLGVASPRIVMHPILRIAISYGVMWCVLHAMYYGGGGLMGFKVTATAWLLANAAMIAGFVLIPFLHESAPTGSTPRPNDDLAVAYVLLVLLIVQGVGTTLAGWVHGD